MANKYFRKALIPSAATETLIYTVPEGNMTIAKSFRITNANAARATITVSQYDEGAGAEHFLLKGYILAPNATIDVFNGVPLVLQGFDTLKVESSVATVHCYLSYLEIDRA
jgi:hypothetical protein